MRCEHRHLGGPGNFGFTWLQCRAQRGLRSWWSEDRTWLHVACPAHYVELRWRWPAADLPEAPAWDLPVETVVFPDPFIDHAPDATAETEYATYWSSGSGSAT